jgi:hypothetical protein
MAYFLKGIGDAQTGKNEIKPSFDARINKFLTGHTAGIIKDELEEFGSAIIDRGVRIKSGMLCAYGYFAMSDAPSDFFYSVPTGTLYAQIYAEIDLAPRPQNFEIKTTTPAPTDTFTAVQDNLAASDGKYQIRLYTVKLEANAAITVTDKRSYIDMPLNAVNAKNAAAAGRADSAATADICSETTKINGIEIKNDGAKLKADEFIIPKKQLIFIGGVQVNVSSSSTTVYTGDDVTGGAAYEVWIGLRYWGRGQIPITIADDYTYSAASDYRVIYNLAQVSGGAVANPHFVIIRRDGTSIKATLMSDNGASSPAYIYVTKIYKVVQ